MAEAPEPIISRRYKAPKESKPFANTGYTVAQFMRLSLDEQQRVLAKLNASLTFAKVDHESGRALTVGKYKKPS